EGFVLALDGIEEPAVGRLNHDGAAVIEQLRGLRPTVEPDDLVFDRVKLGEGPLLALWRRKGAVDLVRLHAVGQQGPLEVDLGSFAQGPFAGKLLEVEQVLDGGRLL